MGTARGGLDLGGRGLGGWGRARGTERAAGAQLPWQAKSRGPPCLCDIRGCPYKEVARQRPALISGPVKNNILLLQKVESHSNSRQPSLYRWRVICHLSREHHIYRGCVFIQGWCTHQVPSSIRPRFVLLPLITHPYLTHPSKLCLMEYL